jgi:hypothetical protein
VVGAPFYRGRREAEAARGSRRQPFYINGVVIGVKEGEEMWLS